MDDPSPLDTPQGRAELYARATASVPRKVEAATVAMVLGAAGAVEQHGTGALFTIADQHFVATARHVVLCAVERGAAMGASNAHGAFVPLPADQWHCTGDSGQDAWADVAVCRLNAAQAAAFDGKSFLRQGDMEPASDLAGGYFFLFAFLPMLGEPSPHEGVPVGLGGLRLGAALATCETSGLHEFRADLHFLLDVADEDMYGADGEETSLPGKHGRPVRFVDGVHGASGCAVWRLRLPARSPDDWRLVGVQTGVYPQPHRRHVKATRWRAVQRLIYSSYEELRPAMRIVTPHW